MHQNSNFVDQHLQETVCHGTAIVPFQIYLDQQINEQISLYTHWHDKIEILACQSGSFELTIENQTYLVEAGDYFIINQAYLHAAKAVLGLNSAHHVLIFDLNVLSRSLYDFAQSHFLTPVLQKAWLFPQKIDRLTSWGQRCCTEIDEIFSNYQQQRFGWELSVKANFMKVITILLVEEQFVQVTDVSQTFTDEKTVMLKVVLDYIQQHYAKKLTLSELSALANLSPEYFCRVFKQYTGTTAIEHLHDVRIEHAVSLLLQSDLPVLAISLQVGFEDQSYFSKKFKAAKGLTPAKFRKQYA
ncbi:MAG: helix-turn-helix domain-containing protein, partial [Culicoidibacterales bacterium]